MSISYQLSMFGRGTPSFDASFSALRRIELTRNAWMEKAPGWLSGHELVLDELALSIDWRQEDRPMYGRMVETPRLYALLPEGARPPIIESMRIALENRYGVAFERVSMAFYRNGRDSVAFHGDTIARDIEESLMASVSVGAPRRFLVRPTGGGPSFATSLGSGDLLVMGGTIQRTHQHGIPKVANAEPRIVIMFRPAWTK